MFLAKTMSMFAWFVSGTSYDLNGPWLGMTDKITEGTWAFESDGKPAPFAHWQPGEPNGGTGMDGLKLGLMDLYWIFDPGENCVLMYQPWNFPHKWVDAPCSLNMGTICELDFDTARSMGKECFFL